MLSASVSCSLFKFKENLDIVIVLEVQFCLYTRWLRRINQRIFMLCIHYKVAVSCSFNNTRISDVCATIQCLAPDSECLRVSARHGTFHNREEAVAVA